MLPTGAALLRLLDGPVRPGEVVWLGLRPARRAPMIAADVVELTPQSGIEGDRYEGRSGNRHVTLIAAEHLADIGAWLGRPPAAPADLRRNVVTRGINLLALKDRQVRLGSALLQITGECHPCSRMEEVLGPGGYNAVRGHGGLTARVVEAGSVRIGDAVSRAQGGP